MLNCCCSTREPVSINGRKYRPLLPKPNTDTSITTAAAAAVVATPDSSCSCCLHRPKLTLPSNDSQKQLPSARSKRWSPTTEQLAALKEMYKEGTQTPTPEQIQRMASKLQCFGHVEGKNIFYWFQNHKARERQQKRRHPQTTTTTTTSPTPTVQARRKSGLSKKCFGSGKGKQNATSNCSGISEESAESMNRALWSQQIMKTFAANDQEPQTLELFPVNTSSSGDLRIVEEGTNHHQIWKEETCNSFIPSQFFEFLPLKK